MARRRRDRDRCRTVDEMTNYLITHNGPDDEGRAHPQKTRLFLEDVEEALGRARERGHCLNTRPYHIRNVGGVWQRQEYLDETLVKLVGQILQEKYDGSIVEMVKRTSQDDFSAPLIDLVDGRSIPVNCNRLFKHHNNSPYSLLMRYIELKGLQQRYAALRPFHFAKATNAYYDDTKSLDEIVVRKIDWLLAASYDNDLLKLAQNVTRRELSMPFVDILDGQEVEVSTHKVLSKLKSSTYDFVMRYVKLKGLEERFGRLKPYHFLQARRGTYDEATVDKLVTRRINQLIVTKYGTLPELILNTSHEELSHPLIDIVDNRRVPATIRTIVRMLKDSPFQFVKRYIEIHGLQGRYADLRSYHFNQASKGTYQDKEMVEEIITTTLDRVLAAKFDNDLESLLAGIKKQDLSAPMVDMIDGVRFETNLEAFWNNVKLAQAVQTYLRLRHPGIARSTPAEEPDNPDVLNTGADKQRIA